MGEFMKMIWPFGKKKDAEKSYQQREAGHQRETGSGHQTGHQPGFHPQPPQNAHQLPQILPTNGTPFSAPPPFGGQAGQQQAGSQGDYQDQPLFGDDQAYHGANRAEMHAPIPLHNPDPRQSAEQEHIHEHGHEHGHGHGHVPLGYATPIEGGLDLASPKAEGKPLIAPQSGWLTARGVCKTYGKRQVVKEASICVKRGESVGLLGPNGAGKTTIFYMITGLVKADEGLIHIDGYDVTKLPMYRRARLGIGYLPQEASIFRGLTVEQNILAVLEVTEKNKEKRAQKLESLLSEFNIARLRSSPSIALSGGERRRCEIARALASDPSYILLDEPFAGIDPIAIGDIRDLVRHLTDRGIGVLITDHNVRETLEMIDRAYIIHDGQVLTEGTPHEIVSNDDVRRVYLGDMFG